MHACDTHEQVVLFHTCCPFSSLYLYFTFSHCPTLKWKRRMTMHRENVCSGLPPF